MANTKVSRALRELIYARSGGHCQHCGNAIDVDTFHVSHLRARANGGILDPSNLEAWCQPCNLTNGAQDINDPRPLPREWQKRALEPILSALFRNGAATLSAAPGAGKTIFAGQVFDAARDLGLAERMVVLAPRLALVDQWQEALFRNCHIELKKHAAQERPGQAGTVATYQSLGGETIETQRIMAASAPTLLILDEVHHVGEEPQRVRPAWARNVASFAGELGHLNVAGVLNLSGTLWRSDASERISTVRYDQLPDGRILSLVDFEVTTEELILRHELRPLDLYRLGTKVSMQDWQEIAWVDSDLADLDEKPARAALASLGSIAEWRTAFVASVLDRLESAFRALDGHPVKALIVSPRQEQARAMADEVDAQMRARDLRPLARVAVSDDGPDARDTLEEFKAQRRVGVLCTVDMAGEGYDCPDIAVVGYASNKLTSLYVRQVVARAMRVTDIERRQGQVIPAAIVVPDAGPLIEQMVAYLAPYTAEIVAPPADQPKPRPAGDTKERQDPSGGQRFVMTDADASEINTVSVAFADGSTHSFAELDVTRFAARLEAVNVPGVFAPRVMVANQADVDAQAAANPFTPSAPGSGTATTTVERNAQMFADLLHKCVGWWSKNGDTNTLTVAAFAYRANEAGGITGGHQGQATPQQLYVAWKCAAETIRENCYQKSKPLPSCARTRKAPK